MMLPANKLELWFALEAERFQAPVLRYARWLATHTCLPRCRFTTFTVEHMLFSSRALIKLRNWNRPVRLCCFCCKPVQSPVLMARMRPLSCGVAGLQAAQHAVRHQYAAVLALQGAVH
eukprot:GHRQ01024679.1.p1 GENE.GHRQ01024679.1~~GHRQ01024679.1.p1  ORF type:complete len:118 (-),score=25.08 GHRQ01024679.1:459-812(-)